MQPSNLCLLTREAGGEAGKFVRYLSPRIEIRGSSDQNISHERLSHPSTSPLMELTSPSTVGTLTSTALAAGLWGTHPGRAGYEGTATGFTGAADAGITEGNTGGHSFSSVTLNRIVCSVDRGIGNIRHLSEIFDVDAITIGARNFTAQDRHVGSINVPVHMETVLIPGDGHIRKIRRATEPDVDAMRVGTLNRTT